MRRRDFLGSVTAGIVFSSVITASSVRAADAKPSVRPNVLFVFVDQWRASAFEFEPYHDALVRTPNLKAFVDPLLCHPAGLYAQPRGSDHRALSA